MTDPYVHVALIGLGQGAEAAHQEQAVNRSRRIAAVTRFIGKRTGQALGFGEDVGVRFVVRQAGRRAARNVTWQQRVIDVKKQRQQGQHALLAGRKSTHGPRQAALVERQEPCTQLAQHLAVDAFFQVGADFMGAGHVSSNRLDGAGRGRPQDEGQFSASAPGLLSWFSGFLASDFHRWARQRAGN
ncbi:hypothetical protein D3C87_1369430 [compost metagenome]